MIANSCFFRKLSFHQQVKGFVGRLAITAVDLGLQKYSGPKEEEPDHRHIQYLKKPIGLKKVCLIGGRLLAK